MNNYIQYFQTFLHTAFALYFGHESEYASLRDIPLPEGEWLASIIGEEPEPEEQVVLMLALMPHISPQALDLFFIRDKNLDRPYTEFGGWRGTSHTGFLPTAETAAFILSIGDPVKRETVVRMFSKEHWFHTKNILRLEGQGTGEPFLSGRLCVSEELLAKVSGDQKYRPDYSSDFPAKRIETALGWEDLVLPYNLRDDLNDISLWLKNETAIRERWKLDRFVKPGYRCLFYGPPGTGKTLTATLLGKQYEMDVYRIDLSMIVSKYIGETEKNLARIFDRAEKRKWILFFDEADALFGKRTESSNSNDRHANQEVAYLLQRIEDFPGMVVLATNLKENLDEAFFRRFQSVLYFPVPNERLREELWQKMIPEEWLGENADDLLHEAATAGFSGGSMVNIIQTCAVKLHGAAKPQLTLELLRSAMKKEQEKEGKLVNV